MRELDYSGAAGRANHQAPSVVGSRFVDDGPGADKEAKVLAKLRMAFPRALLLLFLLNAMVCSASYIRATVKDNPLDVVASEAQRDWSVDRIDRYTLRLTKSHVLASLLMLGYCASHATLFYDASASELNIQYYLQGNYLMTVWMPVRSDAELRPGPSGLKSALNHEVDDILRWSRASVTERRVVKKAEPFPPAAPLSSSN